MFSPAECSDDSSPSYHLTVTTREIPSKDLCLAQSTQQATRGIIKGCFGHTVGLGGLLHSNREPGYTATANCLCFPYLKPWVACGSGALCASGSYMCLYHVLECKYGYVCVSVLCVWMWHVHEYMYGYMCVSVLCVWMCHVDDCAVCESGPCVCICALTLNTYVLFSTWLLPAPPSSISVDTILSLSCPSRLGCVLLL